MPVDFFDLGTKSNLVETENKVSDEEKEDSKPEESINESEEAPAQSAKVPVTTQEDALPEGFFDDPLLDAKVRLFFSFVIFIYVIQGKEKKILRNKECSNIVILLYFSTL